MFAAPRLVARGDEPQRAVVQGVEDGEVALAGHAEGQLGAVQHELVDEDLAAGAAHRAAPGAPSSCSRKTVARWVLGLSASAGST